MWSLADLDKGCPSFLIRQRKAPAARPRGQSCANREVPSGETETRQAKPSTCLVKLDRGPGRLFQCGRERGHHSASGDVLLVARAVAEELAEQSPPPLAVSSSWSYSCLSPARASAVAEELAVQPAASRVAAALDEARADVPDDVVFPDSIGFAEFWEPASTAAGRLVSATAAAAASDVISVRAETAIIPPIGSTSGGKFVTIHRYKSGRERRPVTPASIPRTQRHFPTMPTGGIVGEAGQSSWQVT